LFHSNGARLVRKMTASINDSREWDGPRLVALRSKHPYSRVVVRAGRRPAGSAHPLVNEPVGMEELASECARSAPAWTTPSDGDATCPGHRAARSKATCAVERGSHGKRCRLQTVLAFIPP
jgi:hypothetical protein